jgi:LPS sulfotransferase NodH
MPVVTTSLIIAATPRSGSWLMSDALTNTGRAGLPEEYFRPDHTHLWRERWKVPPKLSYRRYITAAIVFSTTPNGVFSAKLHWYQFEWLLGQIRSYRTDAGEMTDAQLIADTFRNPRYLFLDRRDHARQAISYYRAAGTNTWFVVDGDEPEDEYPVPDAADVDLKSIRWFEDYVKDHHDQWRAYFAESGIEPLEVVYEDFSDDYEATVRRVMSWLGEELPADETVQAPGIVKQADRWTEEVLERYLPVRDELPDRPKGTVWSRPRWRFEAAPSVAR